MKGKRYHFPGRAARVLTPAAFLLKLEGAASAGITVDGGDISNAAKLFAFGGGATRKL